MNMRKRKLAYHRRFYPPWFEGLAGGMLQSLMWRYSTAMKHQYQQRKARV